MSSKERASNGPKGNDPETLRHRELLDAIDGLAQQIRLLAAPPGRSDPRGPTGSATGVFPDSTSILSKLEELVAAVEAAVDTVTLHAELIDGILQRFGDERVGVDEPGAEAGDVRACLTRVSEACREQSNACQHLRQLIREIAVTSVHGSRGSFGH